MAFVPTPNTVRIAIEWDFNGVEVINTLWAQSTIGDEFDASQLESIASAIELWWTQGEVRPLQSSLFVLNRVTATAQASAVAPSVSVYPLSVVAGGSATAAYATAACICTVFNTSFRGRSYQGRNYVSGLTEGLVSNNQVTSAFRTAILNDYSTDLVAALTALDLEHVVNSKTQQGVPSNQGVNTPVIGYAINDRNLDFIHKRKT